MYLLIRNIKQAVKYFDIFIHCGIKTYINVLKNVMI